MQSFLLMLWVLLEIKDRNKDFSPYRKKSWRTMLRFAITLLVVITSSTSQKYGCLEGDTQKLEPSPEPSMQECTLYSKCKSGLIFPNMVKKYSIVHTNFFGSSTNFFKIYKIQYILYLENLLHWHFAAWKSRVRFWALTKWAIKFSLTSFIFFSKSWCSLPVL